MATLIGEPVIRHVGASLETEIAGQHMELLPEKALYWPRERTLFVADLHLGKAAHFRAEAVPVPMGTTRENLSRLARLLKRTGAERLVILGDLWHSQQALAPATLELVHAWRTKYSSLEAVLVMGNHDAKLDAIPKAFALRVEDEGVVMGPFELRHHPSDQGTGAY
ncbi:MAG: ligase-associated DNA damage response endonuclease PdeM, partial [Nitrospirae bacterium]|nr:ligase-associated DNA damage response endonuclease PdeM [Fimbriimonadaceae bacterium]